MRKVIIFSLLIFSTTCVQRESYALRENKFQEALISFLKKGEKPIFEGQLSAYPTTFFIFGSSFFTLICFIASSFVKNFNAKVFNAVIILGVLSFVITVVLISGYVVGLEPRRFLITDKRLIYCRRFGSFQFVYFDTITSICVVSSMVDYLFGLHSLEVFDKNGHRYVLSGMEHTQLVAKALKRSIDKNLNKSVRLYC